MRRPVHTHARRPAHNALASTPTHRRPPVCAHPRAHARVLPYVHTHVHTRAGSHRVTASPRRAGGAGNPTPAPPGRARPQRTWAGRAPRPPLRDAGAGDAEAGRAPRRPNPARPERDAGRSPRPAAAVRPAPRAAPTAAAHGGGTARPAFRGGRVGSRPPAARAPRRRERCAPAPKRPKGRRRRALGSARPVLLPRGRAHTQTVAEATPGAAPPGPFGPGPPAASATRRGRSASVGSMRGPGAAGRVGAARRAPAPRFPEVPPPRAFLGGRCSGAAGAGPPGRPLWGRLPAERSPAFLALAKVLGGGLKDEGHVLTGPLPQTHHTERCAHTALGRAARGESSKPRGSGRELRRRRGREAGGAQAPPRRCPGPARFPRPAPAHCLPAPVMAPPAALAPPLLWLRARPGPAPRPLPVPGVSACGAQGRPAPEGQRRTVRLSPASPEPQRPQGSAHARCLKLPAEATCRGSATGRRGTRLGHSLLPPSLWAKLKITQ